LSPELPLLGPNGCLSPRGIEALRRSPPGQALPELAAHVAGCARCQQRLLEKDQPRSQVGKPRGGPRYRWLAAIAIVGLLMALAALLLGRLLG
jgi:hypothetical protein